MGRGGKLALATALAVLSALGAARAEYPPPLIFGHIFTVEPEDVPIIRKNSTPLFEEGAATGMNKEWSNPQTGNSGAVKLRRVYNLKGVPCRTFDYTTWTQHHTNVTRVTVDWCKLANDGWKLVDPRNGPPGLTEK